MTIGKILVPVDFSEHSERALAYALEFAKGVGAEVDVLHVFPVAPLFKTDLLVIPTRGGNALPVRDALRLEAEEDLERFLSNCAKRSVVARRSEVIPGTPATSIVKYAAEHQYDLIVMGTRGRTGPSRILLGSVAQRVVEHSPCPVLTTRAS